MAELVCNTYELKKTELKRQWEKKDKFRKSGELDFTFLLTALMQNTEPSTLMQCSKFVLGKTLVYKSATWCPQIVSPTWQSVGAGAAAHSLGPSYLHRHQRSDATLFDPLKAAYQVFVLDDFAHLWSNGSEWHREMEDLMGPNPYFDATMKVRVTWGSIEASHGQFHIGSSTWVPHN